MYIIKNNERLNIRILGKVIPRVETKVESLTEYFGVNIYNGEEQTSETLFKLIKNSYKGSKIELRETDDLMESPEKEHLEATNEQHRDELNKTRISISKMTNEKNIEKKKKQIESIEEEIKVNEDKINNL